MVTCAVDTEKHTDMRPYTSEEIRHKYDSFACEFDRSSSFGELLGVGRLRQRLLRRASGQVLEVAVGTGANLRYYPSTCQITAVDLSQAMLEIAHERARRLKLNATFLLMDAESLGFDNEAFDTIVSSMSVCTFPDPIKVLQEMARICRKDGRILLLEHGRSNWTWLGRWQDRREESHATQLGCHWNREPLALIREAGLQVINSRRTFFGIFHEIEVNGGDLSLCLGAQVKPGGSAHLIQAFRRFA